MRHAAYLLSLTCCCVAMLASAGTGRVECVCVYYPHWHRYPKGDEWFGADRWKEGEWAFVKDAKPRFSGHRQPIVPCTGYLDGANPSDVEKEIALASNAGIDVFLYDYYWYDGKVTQEEAIERGFLRAKNRDRMKFAVMWCYHDRNMGWRVEIGKPRERLMSLAHTRDEFLGLIRHCTENYFNRPEYWRKDGKLFFSVFNALYFFTGHGKDVKEIRAELDEAREIVRAAGLGEMHFNAQLVGPRYVDLIAECGFDSITDYNTTVEHLPKDEMAALRAKNVWEVDYRESFPTVRRRWREMSGRKLPYIPNVTTGWDSTPRCRLDEPYPWRKLEYPYTMTFTNNTPDAFREILAEAKAFAENDPGRPGAVYINGWNEYTEGTHLVPNNFDSDGFLRAVASVFGRKPHDEYVYVHPHSKRLFTIPAPTYEDVSYGAHPRQKVDVFLPRAGKGPFPTVMYMHGGGWGEGAMEDHALGSSIRMLLGKGVAVIATGYRYLRDVDDVKPRVIGCIADCERAVRFAQSRAAEWNLDLSRFALAGGSAGACTALALALKCDNALGVAAVASIIPQTTIDPKEMREWVPNINYGAHAFGYRNFDEWLVHRDDCMDAIEQISPAALLRRIDPSRAPRIVQHGHAMPKCGDLSKDATHSPVFMAKFKEIADARGIPCEIVEGTLPCFGAAFVRLADVLTANGSNPCSLGIGRAHPVGVGVESIVVEGEDWAAKNGGEELWELELCRTNDFAETRVLAPRHFSSITKSGDSSDELRIVWRDPVKGRADGVVREAWVSIRTEGGKNRWRIGCDVEPGWALVKVEFPKLSLKPDAGGDDDCLMCGGTVSGVIRNPADDKRHVRDWLYVYTQPFMSSAFFCRYTSRRLFYFACEDGNGNDKGFVCVRRKGEALVPMWIHNGWWMGRSELSYDVVTASAGAKPGLECDWRDAADLYRQWATRQKWCERRMSERGDLADLYRQGPALVCFNRRWLDRPDYLFKWIGARRKEGLGEAPVFAAIYGWEKWWEWVGPDYFPPYPDENRLRKVLAGLRSRGVRPFLWPSSYNYAVKWKTPCYVKGIPTLAFDHSSEAERDGVRRMSIVAKDGQWTHNTVWMGEDGALASLCPHAEGTDDWFERTAVRPLMERGAVALQLDQLDHVLNQHCWSRAHGHHPNVGNWMYSATRRNLEKNFALMKRYDQEASIAGEGPCEMLLGVYALQDVRDCRFFGGEWGNAFTYIYHDYILPFQAGCHPSSFWYAKMAAEGQMPQFPCGFEFYDEDGRFKDRNWERFCSDWAKLYHGEGRKWLSLGKMVRPPRLDCEKVRYKGKFRGQTFDALVPAVFHAAFEAADGSCAVSLANATDSDQVCSLGVVLGGRKSVTLAPREFRLVPIVGQMSHK